MKKLKNILLTGLSFVLVAAVAIGGTLAYLTSEDSDVNVMTLGNVAIDQFEYERVVDGNGNFVKGVAGEDFEADYGITESYKLKEFDQYKPAYPAVYTNGSEAWDEFQQLWNQVGAPGSNELFDDSMKNVIDKFVFVKNTGSSDAYYRTIIAVESPEGLTEKAIHLNMNANSRFDYNSDKEGAQNAADSNKFYVEIDGVRYAIYTITHTEALKPGDVSRPSFLQAFLDPAVTNEDCAKFGETWEILAFTQAVQTEGFDSADAALTAAFGKIGPDNQPWGDGPIQLPGYVYNQEQLEDALDQGGEIKIGAPFTIDKTVAITKDAKINGNGHELSRAGSKARTTVFDGTMFSVAANTTLELNDIVVDGGAIWTGEINKTLGRGTVNGGVVATGAMITTNGNGKVVLNEGTVIQNNDGVNAISIATRGGGSLTLNGAQIINNTSAAGAIWGGDDITINEGTVISGNHATTIGGAFRMVNGNKAIVFTMNGGKINNNYSDGNGGAIWGGNNATFIFNGGEMAHNYAVGAGGAIWTGTYETYTIAGDFKLYDNACKENIGGAIRFCDHSTLTMSGGSVYDNKANGQSNAFFLNNNSAAITGGSVEDDFNYSGGVGFTIGKADIDGVITFGLSTNHNTAYLAKEFNSIKFTVNESAANFSQFNFKPAADYTYSEGDEAKLICMNDGYKTYWDANTATFRLQAK